MPERRAKVVDDPDFANICKCNIDRLVFDKNNYGRPLNGLNFCCADKIKFDRSFLVILIHHLIILIHVFFV